MSETFTITRYHHGVVIRGQLVPSELFLAVMGWASRAGFNEVRADLSEALGAHTVICQTDRGYELLAELREKADTDTGEASQADSYLAAYNRGRLSTSECAPAVYSERQLTAWSNGREDAKRGAWRVERGEG